jgi:hypothetical protein
MRSPGAVFRKLKEVKFRHLIVLYKQYLKRSPENCRYNHRYLLTNSGEEQHYIGLCLLHQESLDLQSGVYPHLLDFCQATEDCQNCNGFILKYTREDVKKFFDQELNDKKTKEHKYPDICALEWVLERLAVGIPPASWIQELYFRVKNLFTMKG